MRSGQLSEKEMAHMSRNCPTNTMVKGSGFKPPDIFNYSIQMDLLKNLSDHGEVLESMPVGMMTYAPQEESGHKQPPSGPDWHQCYPWWKRDGNLVQRKLGDCLAMNAECLLTNAQPYPGNDLFDDSSCRPDKHLSVHRSCRNHNCFVIHDKQMRLTMMVAKDMLSNPKLNLGHWYAKRQA